VSRKRGGTQGDQKTVGKESRKKKKRVQKGHKKKYIQRGLGKSSGDEEVQPANKMNREEKAILKAGGKTRSRGESAWGNTTVPINFSVRRKIQARTKSKTQHRAG